MRPKANPRQTTPQHELDPVFALIERIRAEEGLGQQEMATRLGLDQTIITKYAGGTKPGRSAIIRLLQTFPERTDQVLAALIAAQP